MTATRSLNRIAKPVPKLKTKPLLPADISLKPETKNYKRYPADPVTGSRYWLIKSEPNSRIDPKTGKDAKFALSDLQLVEYEPWDGVRNYEAKNHMLNMSVGDICLFYHSNCTVPGIVGLAEVANAAHPDELQFNAKSSYYDAKSDRAAPRWWCVDVKFKRRFRHKVSLVSVRENSNLADMVLVKRGRLSVTPVSPEEYAEVLQIEDKGEVDDESIDCVIDRKFIKEK
ncbi:hypothetical protein BABINDRAFT_161102 [Babjeviella inositovora NRRL Y-12698]|uniref:EVE domain-containing protein n=1 Tax=Babjeviella inositovora NRRL Y-12698 TaxID=984486 RepID=A0A1E3QQZ1_9ASCO|nr:uncharacterized protein BABINDRAFT_161102 [Babjeviella inositovora NRRL Y-12698]ODQ80113.1 hypothetical protein BABINDRAFT_161102 [Babjeviella inositovora NRRL Y-12698]